MFVNHAAKRQSKTGTALACSLLVAACSSGEDSENASMDDLGTAGGFGGVGAGGAAAGGGSIAPGAGGMPGGAVTGGGMPGLGGMANVGGASPSTGGTPGSVGPPPDAGCLSDITAYDQDGPFDFDATSSGSIKMWVPAVPAGCKVPMVHLANGTGARCSNYGPSLQRLASHGFLALCYESTQTGAGTQGIEAFETALAEYPDLADLKFGSTGHSQGGQAAFVVLQFAEEKWGAQGVYAGLAMQPASGFGDQPAGERWTSVYAKIQSPMFMFSGQGSDGLVSQSWVQDGFDALSDTVEAYHWTKQGGRHIPVPNGEEQQISIPWFRWKLLGDQNACQAFKAIPMQDPTWTVADSQNEQPCQ